MVQLQIENEIVNIASGTKAKELFHSHKDINQIYAIMLDHKLHDLNYEIKDGGILTPIKSNSETGRLIYERTLHFAFIVAVKQADPTAEVVLEHALSGGIYCKIKADTPVETMLESIKTNMKRMIQRHEQIEREVVDTKDAVTFFTQQGMLDKAELLKGRQSTQSSIYRLCGIPDYFYGIMLPDLGYLTHYALRCYKTGFWLSPIEQFEDQKKLFHVFQEFETWGRLIEVSTIDQLNRAIRQGRMDELVLMSEAMTEKKLSILADKIVHQHPQTRFIMIAGPSSAGKTTFSKRLAIHLKLAGKKPLAISMDDYYKNREDCPKLADGSYDFDSLEALDLACFQETMVQLLKGKAVHVPHFNFKTGFREWSEQAMRLEDDQILIIEGIHGLNPKTNACLPEQASYKIYINALTHLNLDAHNRIPTSDYRLIRRLARDHRTRGWDAKSTISFWRNVRDAEDKYIYPFQEEADTVFNSSMVYELSILKKLVIPILEAVEPKESEYLEANRLKKLLEYFEVGEESAVPRHSIFAEFLGNSIFDVS